MSWKSDVERLIELMGQLIALQNEKDGIDRPGLNEIDKSKTLDDFAKDVNRVSTYVYALFKLIPMNNTLAELGKKLESDGLIEVSNGDDYSVIALRHIMQEHNLPMSE